MTERQVPLSLFFILAKCSVMEVHANRGFTKLHQNWHLPLTEQFLALRITHQTLRVQTSALFLDGNTLWFVLKGAEQAEGLLRGNLFLFLLNAQMRNPHWIWVAFTISYLLPLPGCMQLHNACCKTASIFHFILFSENSLFLSCTFSDRKIKTAFANFVVCFSVENPSSLE